ncbi:hypothetical protein M0R45_008462 [Rubus argutus]|uniref:MHC class I antigen n=1 Tax=Rubus argutus TaxID=59490 RepID=A0AAW1Y1U2_RUBAR
MRWLHSGSTEIGGRTATPHRIGIQAGLCGFTARTEMMAVVWDFDFCEAHEQRRQRIGDGAWPGGLDCRKLGCLEFGSGAL